jgi:phosphate/sulfate permease
LLVLLLMSLATLDLIVGVANDAVNFLNSALGTRAGSMRVILAVASFGVVLGTLFSSGMMEVARNGVFDPSYFSFHSLLFIFVAVMLTDVILLDVYNSFGIPTSTTVSLVFELFGAGTAIGFLTAIERGMDPFQFSEYLNLSSTVRIINGIFSSVGVAFITGLVVQWLARLVFTYRLENTLRYFGGIFSGLAATFILNYLIFKGLKGSVLVDAQLGSWLETYQNQLLLAFFISFSLLAQFAVVRGVNPLRYVVLFGTFSLAMAFAGNDLVNFIGPALGAFQSYQVYTASGMDPHLLMMDSMAEQVETPFTILLAAGGIMIATLWLNGKARKVSETSINLARQGEGSEKFKPNAVSRGVTSGITSLARFVTSFAGSGVRTWTDARFVQPESNTVVDIRTQPAFDYVRGSVNLLLASTLIAYATSLGLPLSTTFVVFMVGMGTSLADRAWGQESAVYRVAGVVNVIGSWLLTAVIAFVASAMFAAFLFYGEFIAALILTVFALGLIIRSHMGFADQMKAENLVEDVIEKLANAEEPMSSSRVLMGSDIERTANIVIMAAEALANNQKRTTSRLRKEVSLLNKRHEQLELRMVRIIRDFKGEKTDSYRAHLLAFDYVCDMTESARAMVEAEHTHLANLHARPHGAFLLAYAEVIALFTAYSSRIVLALETGKSESNSDLIAAKRRIITDIQRILDRELQSYRNGEISTRQSHLQTKLLMELRDITALMHRVHQLYVA